MKKPRFTLMPLLWLGLSLSLLGCGDSSGGDAGSGGGGGAGGMVEEGVRFSGIAWSFSLPGSPYGRIVGATVSVLEDPSISTTTNEDGEFLLEGLPVGSDATLVLEHEDHPLTYTKTHRVPDGDLDDLTFQIPNHTVFGLIETFLGIETDPQKCNIVSTFTRFGKTIGDSGHHGEPGAVLSVAPANNAEEGPIYFGDDVLPDRERSYSSLDGGVVLINVDPGDYTLSASCVEDPTELIEEYPPEENGDQSLRCQSEDVQFESIRMKCEAGVFLNASPSYGLQALE